MRKSLVAAVVVAALAGGLPAYGAWTQTVVLRGVVSPGHALRMRAQPHYRRTAAVRVQVYVNGREIPASESGHCTAYYYVRGVTVRMTVCGTRGLRVSAASLRSAKIRVQAGELP